MSNSNKINNFTINPRDWANWLYEIQTNPKHKALVSSKGKINFLNRSIFSLRGKHILSSKEIINISKSILLRKDIGFTEKKKIASGICHIIEKRKENFDNLTFILKFFARLRGVEENLIKEMAEAAHLKAQFEKEVPLFEQIAAVKKKVKNLSLLKAAGQVKGKKQKQFNEDLFQCAKKLYEITEQQSLNKVDANSISELKKQIKNLNSHLPEIESLVQIFGKNALKSNLEATVTALCVLSQLDPQDLSRDCRLFSCDPIEMQSIYVQRMMKTTQTGLQLSTVKAIETTWQKMLKKQEVESKEIAIDGFRVIFDPKQQSIYIKEDYLASGSFKAIFSATSFLDLTKAEERQRLVVVQPLTDKIKDEIEERKLQKMSPQEREFYLRKKKEAEEAQAGSDIEQEAQAGSDVEEQVFGTFFKKDEPKDLDKIPTIVKANKKKDDENAQELEVQNSEKTDLQAYEDEARLCLELGQLPGIWPTHKVITINGEVVIIQKRAGYLTTKHHEEGKFAAEDLSHMLKLFRKEQLLPREEIAYLNMIGDFLRGIRTLHNNGYMHRDLKPENILCTSEGGAGLSDLGTVCKIKVEDSHNQEIDNPEKKIFTGSNYYIAPEITKWSAHKEKWKEIGAAADIWSCGIMLWQLLSGRKIHQHPAIRTPYDHAYLIIGDLLTENSISLQKYESFVKPNNENSLLYLIWKCNRPQPKDRMSIEELDTRYKAWTNKVIQSGQSIQKVVMAETNEYEAQIQA